jgi:SAM-dependent methyltransferase
MLRSLARTVVPKAARDKLWTIRHQIQTKPVMPDLLKRYCAGTGAEIGAGKTPYCDPTRTTFVDKFENNKDATVGADIIADASSIPVGDAVFDYVFSAHVLEHMQNTIAVLNEWLRILKPGGIMFTMLPHAERTLDRFRPITSLEHHLDDLERLRTSPTVRISRTCNAAGLPTLSPTGSISIRPLAVFARNGARICGIGSLDWRTGSCTIMSGPRTKSSGFTSISA